MEKNYLAEKKVRNFFNSFASFFVIHDVVMVSILLTDYFNPYRYSNGAFVQVVSIRQKGDWLPVKHGVNFRGWLMNCADNCPSLSCKLLQSCYQTLGQEWIKPWGGFISKQQWRVCYNLLKKRVFFYFSDSKGDVSHILGSCWESGLVSGFSSGRIVMMLYWGEPLSAHKG